MKHRILLVMWVAVSGLLTAQMAAAHNDPRSDYDQRERHEWRHDQHHYRDREYRYHHRRDREPVLITPRVVVLPRVILPLPALLDPLGVLFIDTRRDRRDGDRAYYDRPVDNYRPRERDAYADRQHGYR